MQIIRVANFEAVCVLKLDELVISGERRMYDDNMQPRDCLGSDQFGQVESFCGYLKTLLRLTMTLWMTITAILDRLEEYRILLRPYSTSSLHYHEHLCNQKGLKVSTLSV